MERDNVNLNDAAEPSIARMPLEKEPHLSCVSFNFDALTRLRGGLSVERDIAPAIGVSPHVLWGWESGRRAPSAATVFIRLAMQYFIVFKDPRYLDIRYWAKWDLEPTIVDAEKNEPDEEKS